MVLGVRNNTPNDIVMVEANCVPLLAHVRQQQKNFWIKINDYARLNIDAPLVHLLQVSETLNLPYVNFYKSLLDSPHITANDFGLPAMEKAKQIIKETGLTDPLSKNGQYLAVNPELIHCDIYKLPILAECDRLLISRYRCGSHKLKIETGRWNKTPREQRLCNQCNTETQTLEHIIYRCPETERLGRPQEILHKFINSADCAKLIRKLEGIIK